ncbi:MAG: hypothetical protein WC465_02140 [Patescibacteria group bacterium]
MKKKSALLAMTTDHPEWGKFMARLHGPRGCNARQKKGVGTIYTCGHESDRPRIRAILQEMGDVDIPHTMGCFTKRGLMCDCAVARSGIAPAPKRVLPEQRSWWEIMMSRP